MREKRTRFLILGLILLIGHAGWSGCTALRTGDDEERPPIVINEASIHFFTEVGWTELGGEKKVWRPKQPNGQPVKHYDVVVTSNGGDAGCRPMKGKTVIVTYDTLTFNLITKANVGGSKDEPELGSLEALTLDAAGKDLSYADAGKILSVKVDNERCDNLRDKPAIKITATPKNQ